MVSVELLNSMLFSSPEIAWKQILSELMDIFSSPFSSSPIQEIVKREKNVSDLEIILSASCWDIWRSFEQVVPKTGDLLKEFWDEQQNGKAVFIIDGLSLREMPFLLVEAEKRGFSINKRGITGAELPSETTYFAKKLGFGQRSALECGSTGKSHRMANAKTDCVDLPWKDCLPLINAEPNWILWHTWFDDQIHELNEPGKGLRELSIKSEKQFMSHDFWMLVGKLAHGRRLIVTSDHGYAATGDFSNVNEEQADYLKTLFKSQRFSKSQDFSSRWIPPIDVQLETVHGSFRYVLGRRKWKNAGGYPTLAHGGLSIMETLVPFIELSR